MVLLYAENFDSKFFTQSSLEQAEMGQCFLQICQKLFPLLSMAYQAHTSISTDKPSCMYYKYYKVCLLALSQTSPGFCMSAVTSLLKAVGKGEISRNKQQAISPFPTVFSTHLENILPFLSNLKLSSANS